METFALRQRPPFLCQLPVPQTETFVPPEAWAKPLSETDMDVVQVGGNSPRLLPVRPP